MVSREPVSGVSVRARVYGKVEWLWDGLFGCGEEPGNVVKRSPVEIPASDESGE